MRKSLNTTLALAAVVAAAAPAGAQQQESWTRADEDRTTILRFLERDDVSAAAEDIGVSVQDAGRGVLQLDAAEASQVAEQVRAAESQVAANTITITTTVLIIALLILIILLVA